MFRLQTCWRRKEYTRLDEKSRFNFELSQCCLLLRSNVATQDARYSRQESMEVHPFASKVFFISPANWNFTFYFFL